MRRENVALPTKQDLVIEPSGVPEPVEYKTEAWVRYLPCGCVVPPEEHDAVVEEDR